jgi:hypothetical protein
MTTVTWIGNAGDGLWSTPGNWSTDAVPTASDDVIIRAAAAVSVDAGAAIAAGLSIQVDTSSDTVVTVTGFASIGNIQLWSFLGSGGAAELLEPRSRRRRP